jgi:mannose-6-phosphate isomerase-like protein (cupin superfamily)
MQLVKAWEEAGVTIPQPFRRTIKVLFAPDKHGVKPITFSLALIDPGSQTDYHTHDRPELIYVVGGRGVGVCEGKECELQADMVMWVEASEKHQIKNTGPETLKLATVFVPAYTAAENYHRCEEAAKAASLALNTRRGLGPERSTS